MAGHRKLFTIPIWSDLAVRQDRTRHPQERLTLNPLT
jgi:hypothetical protein